LTRRQRAPKFVGMTAASAPPARPSRAFLLILTVGVSLLFLAMIRRFLLAVLLAAVLSALARPLYGWLLRRARGRKRLASIATVVTLVLVVGLPLVGFLGLVATQAVEVSQAAGPWIERQITQGGPLDQRLRQLPLLEHLPALQRLVPSSEQIAAKAGEAASGVATFLVRNLAEVGRGTLTVFLQLFVVLYAMFYFLSDGPDILDRILIYVPLAPEDQDRLLERFVSVGRATLKGSLLIAIIQGALAGLGFWAVGVPAAAFWATVTIVASIVPALGAAIVWLPIVIYLLIAGQGGAAVALFLWSVLGVSTSDNFLRPRLIGRDARMSDLLVLLSTLGGIFLFGAVGFVVGPIVAALFVTVWHLYGEAFADWMPAREVEPPAA
jgi:predicted PurR-regulated permease PerM